MVAGFLNQAVSGQPLSVHGDGSQTRCFTYVDDTVRGTLLAALTPEAEGLVLLDLRSERETRIRELTETNRNCLGCSSEVQRTTYDRYCGKGSEDTRRRVPDITRAGEILDWAPEVPLEDGLARTIEWWWKERLRRQDGG